MTQEAAVAAEGLEVRYATPSGALLALAELGFSVPAGQFVAVIGQSGAGKTTLLRCLNGFVRPSAGRLVVDGVDVGRAGGHALRRLRRAVATVPQSFNLVERASALDNVLFGRLGYIATWRSLAGLFPRAEVGLAFRALEDLGLADKARQRVDSLSGGERQRVAIARALVQEPRLVLADEPAASLDISLTRLVLDALQALNRERGLTVVVNLHDLGLARAYAGRILGLRRGRLVFDGTPQDLTESVQRELYHGVDAEIRPVVGGRPRVIRPAASSA